MSADAPEPGIDPSTLTMSQTELFGADDRIAGRFRIEGFLGRGGMGEVYAVEDAELGGRVALKMIHPNLLDNPRAAARFRREITLARQVTHPNVCRVFDVGRGLVNGRERMFLTMEYLRGETLSQCLARQREGSTKMPAEQALALVKQLAAGLDALHQRGIVHRDLKPGNVMLVEEARLVITDFGLAREVSDEAEPLTEPQGMVGTPAYMAPEQLLGEAASPASDIYAFGLIAFEIATGLRFPAEAELPKGWEGSLRRCLDRAPEARPKSAGEAAGLMGAPVAAPRKRSRRWIAAGMLAGALAAGAVAVRLVPLAPRHAAADPSDSVRELLIRYDKPGNTDLAISQIEKALANGSGDRAAVLHYQLGLAYYERYLKSPDAQDLEKAKAESLESIRLDPQFPDAHTTLGRIYAQGGSTDLAETELKEALRLDARSANAWAALGDLYVRFGRAAEAQEAFGKAVDLAPEDWRWHDALGSFYLNAGKLEDARREFEAATQQTPDNGNAFNDLARAAIAESKYPEAQRLYEHALEISKQTRFYSGLGTALMLQGNYAGATEAFQRAIEMNPKSYAGWANLGAAASWTPGEKARARDAYEKAIGLAEELRKTRPRDPTLLSRLGDYYAATEQPDRAIPLLREALALSPDEPDVCYTAGEAYEILHRRDDALKWVLKAVSLGYSLEYIDLSPELAGLRQDARFRAGIRAQ